MKRTSIFALMAGLVLFAAGSILPGLIPDESVSEFYLKRAITQLKFVLQFSGGMTAFCGLIGLIFYKKMAQHCSLKTSVLALSISAVIGLGIHCILSFLSCYFDSNPSNHPIRYPASICLGTICLAGFLVLTYIYFKARKKNASVTGTVLDVILGLLYCLPFYFVVVTIDNIISGLI